MTNIARLLTLAFFALLLLPTLACYNSYKEVKKGLHPMEFENEKPAISQFIELRTFA